KATSVLVGTAGLYLFAKTFGYLPWFASDAHEGDIGALVPHENGILLLGEDVSVQHPPSDQIYNSGEEIIIDVGSHPGFEKDKTDVFRGEVANIAASLINGKPLPDCLSIIPPAFEHGVIDFQVEVDGDVWDIKHSDGLLIVATSSGISIIDFRDKLNPRIISAVNLQAESRSIEIIDNIVIAGLPNGLSFINITDPRNPSSISFMNTTDLVSSVAKTGNTLYATIENISNASSRLMVIDMSSVDQPNINQVIPIDDAPIYSKVVGNILYVSIIEPFDGTSTSFFQGRIDLYDLTVPSQPVYVGSISEVGWVFGLDVEENILYAASGRNVILFNVTDKSDPPKIIDIDTDGFVLGVSVYDRYMFVAQGDFGVDIFDIADISHPIRKGHFSTPGQALESLLIDTHLVVADHEGGVSDIELGFHGWRIKGTCDSPETVRLPIVLTAETKDGHRVDTQFMLTIKALPKSMSLINDKFIPSEVPFRVPINPRAYIGSPDNEFLDFDLRSLSSTSDWMNIDDPEIPIKLEEESRLILPTYNLRDIAMIDNVGIVLVRINGVSTVKVLDLTDPALSEDSFMGSMSIPGDAYSITTVDRHIFVSGSAGIHILQLNDTSQLELISSVMGNSISVFVLEDIAFSTGRDSLQIYDVTEISHPVLISEIDTPVAIDVVVGEDSVAFLAMRHGGVMAVDISHLT
ncbi:MAG: hypothetical protein HRT90_05685, partial [Candidatus Margulisbacteria bacterium]|nr:hypothetical protein [Candidatus Margulisiibacteriota bacterium]